MNHIDVIKTIAEHLSERKKSAALSNYKVLCNTIREANNLLSAGVEAVSLFQKEVRDLLKADDNVLRDAKATTSELLYFRRIAPVILANDLLVLQKFVEATRPDDRAGTTIESLQEMKRGFTEYNDLATTTRQFFDSLLANAYQLISLDAKEINYQVLWSLSSFYKFATKSLVQIVFNPELEDALRKFESLGNPERRQGAESDITKSGKRTFEEKLVFLLDELGQKDPILFEKIDSIYRFSSDFTHIGYVSTHLVGSNVNEVVFGDEEGPYLPSTENFSELKYAILEVANQFISTIYLPSLIRFAEQILVSERVAPLKESLNVTGSNISKGMQTHFREYFFPLKDGLVGSSETIDLTCQCGHVRKWAPPHEHSERYCEKCGSSFALIVLSGDGGYIMTSEGPVRILGSSEPLMSDEKRAELIAEHFPAKVEVENWTDEQFRQLSQIERDVLSTMVHFGSSCDVVALIFLLPTYNEDDIKKTVDGLIGRRFISSDNEPIITIAEFLKDAALKNYPNPNE